MTEGRADRQERTRMQDLGRGERSGLVLNSMTSATASYLRSNRQRSPRGQRCRRSGPVGPASLHPRHSTVWVFLSLRHSPRTCLSPPRGNPCEEPYQGRLRGSSQSVGNVCRTPDVKENNRLLSSLSTTNCPKLICNNLKTTGEWSEC